MDWGVGVEEGGGVATYFPARCNSKKFRFPYYHEFNFCVCLYYVLRTFFLTFLVEKAFRFALC